MNPEIQQVLSGDRKWVVAHGDCLDVLRTMPDCSVDSVVTDPPSSISFMNQEWDNDKGGWSKWIRWLSRIMRELKRVLKPGGHAIVWALPRTSDLTGMALRLAGFELRDKQLHIFGCLSDDTEILLDGEWKHFSEIKRGAKAMAYDPESGDFRWQPVERLFVYDYDNTAFRVRGDLTDQVVTSGHRCAIEQGGMVELVEAWAAARESSARVPVLEDVQDLLNHLPVPHKGAGEAQRQLSTLQADSAVASNGGEAAYAASDLPGVRRGISAKVEPGRGQSEVLLDGMLRGLQIARCSDSRPHAPHCTARTCWLDGCQQKQLLEEDERVRKPVLEGRRYAAEQPRELQGAPLGDVSSGLSLNVQERRLCAGASAGCCPGAREMPDPHRGRAPCRPRYYEQQHPEPDAFPVQRRPQAIRASRFTTTDLVRFEPFHYSGLVWCVQVSTGAFVARRNGKAFVTGNSGMPKGENISLAIDERDFNAWLKEPHNEHWRKVRKRAKRLFANNRKAKRAVEKALWERAGLVRAVVRSYRASGNAGTSTQEKGGTYATAAPNSEAIELEQTRGATDKSREWDGWATGLKPAAEDWWLCRKPLDGTIAQNVLQHGTGGLHIDACRVPRNYEDRGEAWARSGHSAKPDAEKIAAPPGDGISLHPGGGWPANVLLSHSIECRERCAEDCPVMVLGEQSGELLTSTRVAKAGSSRLNGTYGTQRDTADRVIGHGDSGTAARYFNQFRPDPGFIYLPKPSTAERDAGLEGFRSLTGGQATMRTDGSNGTFNPRAGAGRLGGRKNNHQTVKGVALMRHFVRLVTPPGGVVVDAFNGSGSTGVAAVTEGFRYIGIEKYNTTKFPFVDIARARIEYAIGIEPEQAKPGFRGEAKQGDLFTRSA